MIQAGEGRVGHRNRERGLRLCGISKEFYLNQKCYIFLLKKIPGPYEMEVNLGGKKVYIITVLFL